MKKMNILKFALTLVLAFEISGAFAQTNVPGAATDYEATGSVTVMEGTNPIPLYAFPDLYFHPSYTPDAGSGITAGFAWHWTELVSSDITFSTNDANDNYVTISGMLVANSPYTINVKEVAPVALGGCSDAGTNITVNVVAQPNVTIGGDNSYSYCEANPFLPANIQSTITGGWQNYRMVWTLEIATLDDASAKEFYYDDEAGAGRVAGQKYAVEYTTLAPQAVANAAAAPNLMTVPSFDVINNGTRDAVTVYTYVLTSINDQASRFGDFIALSGIDTDASAFSYYKTGAAETVVVTVYPAPVTGPIYHIINTWAN